MVIIKGRTIIGPNVITDGLIVYLDAGNTASISGSTWKDLSNNGNDATNFNSYTLVNEYNGGVRLDGISQYFKVTVPLTRALTTIIFAKSNQSTFSNSGIYSSARTTNGFIMHPQSGNTNLRSYIATSYLEILPSLIPSSGIQLPHFYAITTNGIDKHTTYVSDNQSSTSTTNTSATRTDTPTSGNVYLGYDYPNPRYGNITIYTYMIYNRELSPVEINQNLNALKGRFGIK